MKIGCDLTFLSAGETGERIALAAEEIYPAEADKSSQTSRRSAAESFFNQIKATAASLTENRNFR